MHLKVAPPDVFSAFQHSVCLGLPRLPTHIFFDNLFMRLITTSSACKRAHAYQTLIPTHLLPKFPYMMCEGGPYSPTLGSNKNVADLTMFFMFKKLPEVLSTQTRCPNSLYINLKETELRVEL